MFRWAALCEGEASGWGALAELEAEEPPSSAPVELPAILGTAEEQAVQDPDGADLQHPLRPQVPTHVVEGLGPLQAQAWNTPLLARPLQQVLDLLGQDRLPQLEPTMAALADFFVQRPSRLHASKEAIGQLAGVQPKKIEPNLNVLADTLLHMDKIKRHDFEQILANSGAQLLLYVDVVRFDETPMRVAQQQLLEDAAAQSQALAGASSQSAVAPPHKHGQPEVVGRVVSPAKMLATDSHFTALLKLQCDGASDHATKYMHFAGTSLTSLQLVERNTGSVLHSALLQNNLVSDHANRFAMKLRLATTDMHPANFGAERRMMQQRPGWMHLHFNCNIHIAALAHSKTFSLAPTDIAGLLNFALSLSHGAALQQFRRALVQVLEQRIQFIHGVPPPAAVKHREWVLALFAQTGANKEVRHTKTVC